MKNSEILKALCEGFEIPEPEEETTKSELVAQVANMKCPRVVKDILMCDLTFHEAIDKLIEKEREAESKEQIQKLTAAVYKLCK